MGFVKAGRQRMCVEDERRINKEAFEYNAYRPLDGRGNAVML